ncbi:hypothetical protein BDV35DRAFT_352839 [Aspergillus flavus]|uniref:Uncharacterized protein n=1 Tax=Aspergillus flavus TaxID=5059 RepID=A0A5N6GZC2_ASPFL|nr:hypothetical protein BDV35DRAFT_352839 [Aspergillus flavus]
MGPPPYHPINYFSGVKWSKIVGFHSLQQGISKITPHKSADGERHDWSRLTLHDPPLRQPYDWRKPTI